MRGVRSPPTPWAYYGLKKVAEQKMNHGEMPDVGWCRLGGQSIGAFMRGGSQNFPENHSKTGYNFTMNETLELFPKPSRDLKPNTWHGSEVLTTSEVEQLARERRKEAEELKRAFGLTNMKIV